MRPTRHSNDFGIGFLIIIILAALTISSVEWLWKNRLLRFLGSLAAKMKRGG